MKGTTSISEMEQRDRISNTGIMLISQNRNENKVVRCDMIVTWM